VKLAVVVVGCTLLSVPAWALDPSGPNGVIVESTTGEGVIVESTTPETYADRRAAPFKKPHVTPKPATSVWSSWLSWDRIVHGILQLLLR